MSVGIVAIGGIPVSMLRKHLVKVETGVATGVNPFVSILASIANLDAKYPITKALSICIFAEIIRNLLINCITQFLS